MGSEDGHRRDASIRFLENYFNFASYTPSITAGIIYAKFRRTRSTKLRKILITKLFSEYTASFELLAALCIALRQRKVTDPIETLTTYTPREVWDFYKSIYSNTNIFNIISYAALPSKEEVRRRTDDPEFLHALEYDGIVLSRRIHESADQLGNTDFLTIHIYNKIKHGSLFVDDPTILSDYYSYGDEWNDEHNDTRVYIAAKLRQNHSNNPPPVVKPTAILDATDEFAHKLVNNTRELRKAAREIAGMMIALNRFGLLW